MRVGVIGCGNIAKGIHIPAWFKMNGADLVAVCDNDEFAVKETAKICNIDRYYNDVADMLAKEELDVVDICTPPQTHAQLATQGMEAGCHVLLEKPFAPSVKEADEIIATSKRHGVKLCVVHNYLFKPIVMKAKSIIANGEIGDLLNISVNFFDRPDVEFMVEDHWCHNLPGGRFGENMIHPLYLIDTFFDITDVVAVQAKKIGNCDWVSFDELRILLDTKKSVGTISLSTNAPKTDNSVVIYGTRGIVHIDFRHVTVFKHNAKKDTLLYPVRDYISLSSKFFVNAICTPFKSVITKNYVRSGHYYLILKFIESIREDKEPPVTGEDAKKMVVLQEKIFSLMNH